ncbi:MAG: N-acetyl-gamma-glutamyl-phosphate reductase [Candidatus Krumholzibacteria bacterium]|nr:N-acetyl-gamma-glutamyl-phosphate reductase [Candidatus Krumholzibacteria bacterium]
MIRVGIIGGTGYTGVELLRILTRHPGVDISVITSRAEAGLSVTELFPNLRGYIDLTFVEPASARLTDCDLVFSATPNGVAMTYARELIDAGVRLIDIAADFRIKDRVIWEQWYGMEHVCPELLAEAVYGLPELNRKQIREARLVANPGCYPTAIVLGLIPLLEINCVELETLIADAKSGVSGAGRGAKVSSLLAEASDNLKAYGVAGHRHGPEIEQTLENVTGREVFLTFVPHLAPMIRGIHATMYARATQAVPDLQKLYEKRYASEPFVDVMPADHHPDTRSVRGSNMCRISVHRPGDRDRLVVLSVIDNLVKGAAGQAVQNMNIMFGLDESGGLMAPPLLP